MMGCLAGLMATAARRCYGEQMGLSPEDGDDVDAWWGCRRRSAEAWATLTDRAAAAYLGALLCFGVADANKWSAHPTTGILAQLLLPPVQLAIIVGLARSADSATARVCRSRIAQVR